MFYENCEDDERPFAWCELCGHPHAQRHRIKPGEWGGEYVEGNVADLCPNHHAAIHFLMAWYLDAVRRPTVRAKSTQDDGRLLGYMADHPLWRFWGRVVKPVVRDRLRAEGKWYPYVRDPNLVEARGDGRPRKPADAKAVATP